MSIFFTLLFLLSPVFLFIGLIRPKTFEKILKSKSRKRIGLVFGVAVVVAIIGMIATTDASKIQKNKSESKDLSAVSDVYTNTKAPEPITESSEAQIVNPLVSEQIIIADEIKVNPDVPLAQVVKKESIPTQQTEVSPPIKKDTYQVASVVDGDTIKVWINGVEKTIRLIGMDTPEAVDPRTVVQCFGKEASNKAKEMLLNKNVRLEVDLTQGDTDKYQRLLRYVFLEDGTFFNKIMIEQGFAHEYTYSKSYKYQVEFKAAQKVAQDGLVGLWSPTTCNGDTKKSASISENVELIQPNGHVFYLSTHWSAVYYYCDTDEVWKKLSKSYLKSYTSEDELLKNFPKRTLHEACK
jgi:micrococcal nuclease